MKSKRNRRLNNGDFLVQLNYLKSAKLHIPDLAAALICLLNCSALNFKTTGFFQVFILFLLTFIIFSQYVTKDLKIIFINTIKNSSSTISGFKHTRFYH